jgi:Outer membrane protein beta-barrel domain
MVTRRVPGLVLGMTLLGCAAAGAQEHGKVGVTMGYPASIGVIFHATDKVAIRPELSFAKNTTDSTTLNSDNWIIGTGVSALFYLASHEHVHTYVSPRFTYTRSSTSIQSSDTTSTSWGAIGSFGAQYSPTPKFSVFGEVGIGYTRQTTKSGVSGLELKGNSVGTRTGVGIIFYP